MCMLLIHATNILHFLTCISQCIIHLVSNIVPLMLILCLLLLLATNLLLAGPNVYQGFTCISGFYMYIRVLYVYQVLICISCISGFYMYIMYIWVLYVYQGFIDDQIIYMFIRVLFMIIYHVYQSFIDDQIIYMYIRVLLTIRSFICISGLCIPGFYDQISYMFCHTYDASNVLTPTTCPYHLLLIFFISLLAGPRVVFRLQGFYQLLYH